MASVRIALFATAALALAGCGQKEAAKAPADSAAAPAAATAAVGPATPPARKPGLWTQTVSMGDFNQTTRLCLDETTDKSMSLWGAQMSKDMCETNETTRGLDGSYRFNSVCDMGSGGTSRTSGVASGDFQTSYKVDAETTTEGASAPQMNGTRKMAINAAWQGPCPEGFKPGDMELPGGMKMNLTDLSGPMKAAGAQ